MRNTESLAAAGSMTGTTISTDLCLSSNNTSTDHEYHHHHPLNVGGAGSGAHHVDRSMYKSSSVGESSDGGCLQDACTIVANHATKTSSAASSTDASTTAPQPAMNPSNANFPLQQQVANPGAGAGAGTETAAGNSGFAMRNILPLHMMKNILPGPADSILGASSASPALDQMAAAAAARLLHSSALLNASAGGEAYYHRRNIPSPGNIPSPASMQSLMSDGIRFSTGIINSGNLLACAMDPHHHGLATSSSSSSSSAHNSETAAMAQLNLMRDQYLRCHRLVGGNQSMGRPSGGHGKLSNMGHGGMPMKRSLRAPRMRWTPSLHAHFVHAVELLGGHESKSP